jgi:transcription antitermination factor NusB
MNRTKAREISFTLIFALDFQQEDIYERLEDMKEEWEEKSSDQIPFIEETVLAVYQNLEKLDSTISDHLKAGWSIGRISKVSLAVLRLAVYEITMTDTPDKAVVNEAINLAKKYDDPVMASFANGVLASVLRERECLSE